MLCLKRLECQREKQNIPLEIEKVIGVPYVLSVGV
jgi:hypothetical protein